MPDAPPPDLRRLFDPRRILLVGASETSLFSASIPRYLLDQGFGDRLTMVNAKRRPIYGRPTFGSIAEAAAAGPFDLAIVVIPAAGVADAIEDVARLGCRLAIVESAGFAETGPSGAARQADLRARSAACGVRLLGPNCVGVVDTTTRFATTAVQPEALRPGGVALVAQSGVFGSILLDAAPAMGLRFSKAITLGNRVDLDEADFLDFLTDDPATRVVAMYLEGVADGRRFLAAARRCAAAKPLLALKSGRTPAGAVAIGSHTAALAGADAVFDGALRQAGGRRPATLEALLDAALALDLCPVPRSGRVGIVTTSGSQGVLAADVLQPAGLELPPLHAETAAKIRALVPAWTPVGNPLDLGPSGVYAEGVAALLADPHIDAVLIVVAIPWGAIGPAVENGMPMAGLLGDLDDLRAAARRKPVVVAHLGYPPFVAKMREAVGDFLPVYPTAERAAAALALLAGFRKSS
jgi:acetyltransferase